MGIHHKHMVKWFNECMLTVKNHRVFVDESCFWTTDPLEILLQGASETPVYFDNALSFDDNNAYTI